MSKQHVKCVLSGGRTVKIEIDEETTFIEFKGQVAAELDAGLSSIVLTYKGSKKLPEDEKLVEFGVEDGDEIHVAISDNHGLPEGLTLEEVLSPKNRDKIDFDKLFKAAGVKKPKADQAAIEESLKLEANEFGDLLETASDMIYIPVQVRGVNVRAFVDTGAQYSIMSKSCALKTKLVETIDPRFWGLAYGMGATRLIGKVHDVPLKIEGKVFPTSFSVIDGVQTFDFLLGLDFLRWYKVTIDPVEGCMHMGTTDQLIKFMTPEEAAEFAQENAVGEDWPEAKTKVPGGVTGVAKKNPLFPKHYLSF